MAACCPTSPTLNMSGRRVVSATNGSVTGLYKPHADTSPHSHLPSNQPVMLGPFGKLLHRPTPRKDGENGIYNQLNDTAESLHENGGRLVQIDTREIIRDPAMEEVIRSPYYSEGALIVNKNFFRDGQRF